MANEFKIKHGFISTGDGSVEGEIRITGAGYADNGQRIATRNWATQYLSDNSYATTTDISNAIDALVASAPGTLDTLNELAAALGDDPNFSTTITNSIATKLPLAGGNMTGNIRWTSTDRGLEWVMNTDGAGIKFYNTGDSDTNSRLEYYTTDNGNEYHRFMVATNEEMTIKSDGVRVTNNIYMAGNLVATQSWVSTRGYGQASDITAVNTRIDEEIIPLIDTKADASHNHDGVYLPIAGKAADSELLDGINSTSFLRSDAADTASGLITFSGGITGFTSTAGISGNNFNITGVNELKINDPGEGINFHDKVILKTIDDATDNKIDFTGATEVQVNGAKLATESWVNTNTLNQAEGDVRYDALGSADAVNTRIDEEVLPAIPTVPTNVSAFTNDAGYITDGNSGWNNSYGFITASSTNTLTNKSGNISQWTNDSGYITDGNTNWNNTYGFITASSTDTFTNKSGNISQWTNDSGYITDGNTNWNNTYGFITGVDWTEIAGDSTNINLSQFTNDVGYITDGNTGWNNTYGFITASDSITGNAATATKLATARNIALSGAVTGNANFDGSGNITIATTATSDPTLTLAGDASGSATFTNLGNATLTVTVANDSHTHDGRYYTEAESDARFVNVTGDTVTGDLAISGATLSVTSTAEGTEAFFVDGVNGRLFTISDDLSDSLFSANTISGLPVIEAFADNTVKLGPYSNPVIIDSTGSLTIGGTTAATESYVDTAISNLIGGAPGALDTLNELAAAINDDASYASTVTTALGTKAPLASPALTGTPTAPTAAASTNSTQIATTAFVKAQGYVTTDTNYYLNGITKSGNTLTFSVNGATNQSYAFGSNAFTSYTNHVGLYDLAGSAAAVDLRIDNEVLPAIQTPAITSNGSTPSLNSGITAAEIRTLIGAGTSSSDTNYYLSGITKSGNTLTFSVSGTTNQTYTFGSNAFTSYTDHSVQGYGYAADINAVDERINNEVLPIIVTPAITSNGSTPSLNSGISAAEVRTLIGAQAAGSYLTSYTESDTLATVTSRGNTTTGSINVNGNILLTGTATTTNQGRMIDFTGFDKEGTTDFSDRAYIQHTTNTGGHSGSVLVISSQNDSNDGIAFLTNASSKLKHNSNNIATENWVTGLGYVTANYYVDGLSFDTGNGVLTASLNGTTNQTVDLDGRYLLSGSNAVSASKLATARNIALSGAVTGSANFDGSGNITIATTATSDPTLTLAGDATGSATFTNLGNATLTVSVVDDSHNHTSLNLTGSIYNGSANYSIDLRDHSDRTWFRNEVGGWTFQTGASGDDWTQSFTFYLPAAGSTANAVWAEFGQRDSNDVAAGRYRGLRIVKDTGGVADGDLRAGAIYIGTTRRDDDWTTAYNWGNHASAGYGQASDITAVNTRIDNEVLPIIQTPAITSNGSTPSLNSGITAGEIRTLIGAGTSSSDTNYYLSGASFNTGDGVLTLTVTGAANQTVDLDGRYQLAGTYNTIIGTDSDINTSGSTIIDNIYVTDGVITSMGTRTLTAADLGIAKPEPPIITATNIVGETIEVVFEQSPTPNIDYYQVWSSVDGGSYGMIAQIPQSDIAATMTVIDASFAVSGTIAYRVYAVSNGIYSDPAQASQAFATPTLDVVNMSVVNLNTAYYIQYDLPDSRFVDHIEIYMDSEAADTSLSRTGASLIYSGNNTNYMYQISAAALNNYHQFWVEVIES